MAETGKNKMDRWNLTALGSHKQQDALTSTDELPEAIRELLAHTSAGLVIQRNSSHRIETTFT